MSKKTIPELLAIMRQRIYTKVDAEQSHMALGEVEERLKVWLEKHNGDFKSFEDMWKAFSGEV